ncbi:hypothetical protein BN1723_016846, partial [Verticillium longisporum]
MAAARALFARTVRHVSQADVAVREAALYRLFGTTSSSPSGHDDPGSACASAAAWYLLRSAATFRRPHCSAADSGVHPFPSVVPLDAQATWPSSPSPKRHQVDP